ncbi:hypothetical protein WME91_09915 [Sorangium sp. So ce269]
MSHDVKNYLPDDETLRRVADQDASDENMRRALENPRLREALTQRETRSDSRPPAGTTPATGSATPATGVAAGAAGGAATARRRTRKVIVYVVIAALCVMVPTGLAFVLGWRTALEERAGEVAAPAPPAARAAEVPGTPSGAPAAAPSASAIGSAAAPSAPATGSAAAPGAEASPSAPATAPRAGALRALPGGQRTPAPRSAAPSQPASAATVPVQPPPPFGDKPEF